MSDPATAPSGASPSSASAPAPATTAALRQSDRPKSRDLRVLVTLWSFVKPYGWQVALAALALIVAAGTVLALGKGLRMLVDEGFASGNSALLDKAVLVLLGVVVLLAGATYARFYLVSWIGERVVADVRRAVFDRVIALSPAYFEINRTGEILSRLTTDTTILQVVVGSSVSVALRNVLLFVGGLVLLMITSPKLTGLVLLVVPLVLLPIIFFGRRVRRLSRESQDRIADVGAYVDESLNAIRTVQAFTHESLDSQRFGQRVEGAFATAVRRISARSALTGTVIVLVFGSISAILWVGGHDVLSGRISAGELSAFVFYAVVVAGAVGSISEVIGDLQRAAGATERLLDLLATDSEIEVPDNPAPLAQPVKGAIVFDRVNFHYPARPEWAALEDFSLEVAPGEKVALVGPSGAGKTTVMQLLLRFYDPAGGSLRFDGVDLRALDPQQLRGAIGLVPQEPVIFAADAWENIRYGRPEASDAEVLEAARAAHCLEFLENLPSGLDSFMGEKGVRLSGGQRQRLAIARAILRDPALLLLDEATSSLDAESEKAVQDALDRLMVGRTSIVIAHRLATVLMADRIIVLDRGRIVQAGSHAELLRDRDGLYARLAALQFDQAEALGRPSYDEVAAK
ncbi:ABC transporter transmembrane domain-containing protein [Algihabitans albus]|uniref:ABC transporter transmembrane domain-containing protein n=1 Tax=Algihabitans albus TaxID=2164067 RepID=UPI000E5CA48E|nr:ABC transporter transmembrane domain-containing protein [Algihabitans albus]